MTNASVRVFLPLTPASLRILQADGVLATPLDAHALTPRLRAALPEPSDEEDAEYVAFCDAGEASARLQQERGTPPTSIRRLVAAADVAAGSARPKPGDTASSVCLSHDVTLGQLVSIHLGDADSDAELSWYDVSELVDVLARLGDGGDPSG